MSPTDSHEHPKTFADYGVQPEIVAALEKIGIISWLT